MSADRHRSRPKAIRMPGALEAWFAEFAVRAGQPVNAVLVRALEDFRARNDGATTQADGATTSGATTPESAPSGATAGRRGATTRRPRKAPAAPKTVTPAPEGVPAAAFQEPAQDAPAKPSWMSSLPTYDEVHGRGR